MDKPTASPAVGAKEKVEKQARQLAYDTRYKVKQAMSARAGGKSDPATVKKAYAAQLSKSPAPPAVKARAKQMLLGEDLVDTKKLATESVVSALYNVFVDNKKEVVEEEIVTEYDYLLQLEETEEKKYKVRVTDKKTGNSYVRMATRAKIAELRSNPNISSVEMTGYGEPTKSEKSKGASTAKAKSGKGLDPVGQEDKDVDNDGDHDKSDKYLLKRRAAVGKAIATRKEDYNWQDGFAELIEKKKEETEKEKKLTGEGVDNSKIVKVFPEIEKNVREEKEEKKEEKKDDSRMGAKNDQARMKEIQILQNKIQALRSAPKGSDPSIMASYEMEGEEEIVEKAPPGAKYERMVKHIKKGYSEGGLTKKEKSIAYATAWKAKNKAMGEEVESEKDSDEREMPTNASILKNKMRSRGIKVSSETPSPRNTKTYEDLANSYEPEGGKIDEIAPLIAGGAALGLAAGGAALINKLNQQKKSADSGKGDGGLVDKLNQRRKMLQGEETANEGELLDERRKEDKVAGTPRKPRNPAFELVAKSMGTGRMGVKPRGEKKVPGKKPPAAGEYGGPKSPAQKVSARRASAQRAQDAMHSRFD